MNSIELINTTCENVVSLSNDVTIQKDKISEQLETLIYKIDDLDLKWSDNKFHYADTQNPELLTTYILVLDATNFCFWPSQDNFEYEHLAGSLKTVLLNNPQNFTPQYLKTISDEEFASWFDKDLPQIEERARLVREVGSIITSKFNGSVVNLISKCNCSAINLLDLVTESFPGFRDHSIYKGKQVFFYKRAQIFVGDIWGAFSGKTVGEFNDIDSLTMFADYRVPQMLEYLQILKYSENLSTKIKSHQEIKAGSEEELEIRAATIIAVNLLQKEFLKKNIKLHTIQVDWLLWTTAENNLDQLPPHHRSTTIYY